MKKHCSKFTKKAAAAVLSLSLLASPAFIQPAFAAQSATTTANVILRQEASTSSKALATIKKGNQLDVVSTSGNWTKVESGNLSGYVYSKYVSLSGSSSSGNSSSSSSSQEKNSAVGNLKRGTEHADVKTLQQNLKSLGFFSGDCTGFFGSITETAVKNFQKAKGLTADGIVGSKTLSAIASALGGSGSGSSNTSGQGSSSASSLTSDLKQGDEGAQVKLLQELLIKAGYLKTEATSFFGSTTLQAVQAFQKANGLTADGIVGAKTRTKLGAVSSSSSSGSNLNSSATLQKGDESSAVKTLQEALISKGYLKTSATGFFGTATEDAVKAFQKAKGLSQTGKADSATQSALYGSSTSGSTGGSSSSSALKKGDESSAVTQLQHPLLTLPYLKTPATGFFGTATEDAVKAFQKDNNLTVDGIAGSSTLSAISAKLGGSSSGGVADPGNDSAGSTPPSEYEDTQTNGSVVLEDWWSGKIDSSYKRGAVAQVIDVQTGITFNISRYGGQNHLDAEPLTAADTDLYMKCFNYVETWSARPILVVINGVKYAAAMNGMPHGGQNITSNNCDGQFCIHFLNSRTHGGNAVNQDMQAQIMVAYNWK